MSLYSTVLFQDISEQKRAFEEIKKAHIALQESEERFRALHNASFGGIAIHDQGLILECNKGMSEITGFTYGELIGMNGFGSHFPMILVIW